MNMIYAPEGVSGGGTSRHVQRCPVYLVMARQLKHHFVRLHAAVRDEDDKRIWWLIQQR